MRAMQKTMNPEPGPLPCPDSDQPFQFPQGLAGFSEARQFAFIYQGHGDIVCLQSIDHPEAALLITPWDSERLGTPPQLPDDQCNCIGAPDPDQILWMVVLNPFADTKWVTANLKAPLAINLDSRIGLQCIRPEPDLDLRYHWMHQPE